MEPPTLESDPVEYQDGPEPNPLVAPVEAAPEQEQKDQEEVVDPEEDEWASKLQFKLRSRSLNFPSCQFGDLKFKSIFKFLNF